MIRVFKFSPVVGNGYRMTALPSPRPPLHPSPRVRRRAASQSRQQRQQNSHQAMAAEVSAKLAVNVVLAIAALTALARLIPYNLAQQEKLEQLQSDVALVERRVDRLQQDLGYYFDPQQTIHGMQQQSNRLFPNQYPVIWAEPTHTPYSQPASTP